MQQQFPQNQNEQERRYDSTQIQRVVEIATRLQQEHRETMTAAQVEQLGTELGLSADFVRAALQVVEAPSRTAPPKITPISTETDTPLFTLRPLTRSSLQRASLIPVVYAVVVGFFALGFTALFGHSYPNVWSMVMLLSCLVIPAFVALAAGGWSRRLRAGALGGFLTGLVSVLIMLLATSIRGYRGADFGPMALLVIAAATLLGILGAGARRWWERLPHVDEERQTAR